MGPPAGDVLRQAGTRLTPGSGDHAKLFTGKTFGSKRAAWSSTGAGSRCDRERSIGVDWPETKMSIGKWEMFTHFPPIAWSGLDISKLVMTMQLRCLCQEAPAGLCDFSYKTGETRSEVIAD